MPQSVAEFTEEEAEEAVGTCTPMPMLAGEEEEGEDTYQDLML